MTIPSLSLQDSAEQNHSSPFDILGQCIHCGLCLPHCPTYALTGLERSSPRGRIRLMKSVAEGEMPISEGFREEMEFCLDCQACETACPAGVQYGRLVEEARHTVHKHESPYSLRRLIQDSVFRHILPQRRNLRAIASLLRFYDQSGLRWFVEESGLLRNVFPSLHSVAQLSPNVSGSFSSHSLPERISPQGVPKYRVAFLVGCLMDAFYSQENIDTVELLLAAGCEVIVPVEQTCCGSLQAHYGDKEHAEKLAAVNSRVFAQHEYDAFVVNSAGCGAFLKNYAHLLKESELAAEASLLSKKTMDIAEFLVAISFDPSEVNDHPFVGKRVTYHDACHLAHAQKITRQPRELIRSVPGIDYVELPESLWCCGSAGIYNIVRNEDSMKLLDRKMLNIEKISPDIVVTGNPGCLAQLNYGIRRNNSNVEVIHTATFLRRIYAPSTAIHQIEA
jgi:glycolate oxidase iron-sulfur subunit